MSGFAALAPFRTRSFRFQWPADLCTAWALEMETLILGWYVLVESGSVVLLTVFGALQFVGTLVSPVLGVLGDRLGLRNVLLTVLSRIGQNSRVVLTHDVAQRDNLRVGRHDGVVAVVEKLKGHPLFAHVTLHRSERSPIAALVTEMLEDIHS